MMRRRGRLRRLFPWLAAVAIVFWVGRTLHHATALSDVQRVALAERVRQGDPENGVAKDPMGSLEIVQHILDRDPDHYQALMQAAKAYADLRSYDQAVVFLEQAAENSRRTGDKVRAKQVSIGLLNAAERYDEAVDMAAQIVDLEPDDPVRPLQYGIALYKASVASQDDIVNRFVDADIDDHDVLLQEKIEEYVTDIWGTPDVAPLIDFLAPKADSALRETLTEDLTATRRRFNEASEAMRDYQYCATFEPSVAQSYVEMLLRSGRLFEAYIESSIALREKGLTSGQKRAFLEVQARCSLALGEYGNAADIYGKVIESIAQGRGRTPGKYVHLVMECRVKAEQWDWILENRTAYSRLVGGDVFFQYAVAAALAATGDIDAAVQEISEPFAAVGLAANLPGSVRGDPGRRRDILMLSYRLFAEVHDSRALTALDSLLLAFPADHEARRLRIDWNLQRGLLDAAVDDAFQLLTRDRRDTKDVALWLDTADRLCQQRYGQTLDERARDLVTGQRVLHEAEIDADFEIASMRPGDKKQKVRVRRRDTLPPDPALASAVVKARVESNNIQRARIDMRQLSETHPQVQMFRYNLGRLLVREGKLESAAVEFRDLLEEVPSDTEALDLAMRIEIALGRSEEAANLVNTMILQDPLGVGAIRYGQRLLEKGLYDQAVRLMKRLLAWGREDSIETYIILGRGHVGLGDYQEATALVTGLFQQQKYSVGVALLGLELGLAEGRSGLVEGAVSTLRPLAGGLFPDQVASLSQMLIDNGLHNELLEIFEPEIRELPAVRPALRSLARAAKATGDFEEADLLLARLDDEESLRDRFLLLTFQGRSEEASRRLRLEFTRSEDRDEVEVCQLVANALAGFPALVDASPTSRLRDLGMEEELSATELELFDAALRIAPAVHRLDDIVPPNVVQGPKASYLHSGDDVLRLVATAAKDPEAVRAACESALLLLMCKGRVFWEDEVRFLAEHSLEAVPGLHVPSAILSGRYLRDDMAKEALEVLKLLLLRTDPDPESLAQFSEAARAFDRDEWGIALPLAFPDRDDVQLMLADALVERKQHDEALPIYVEHLKKQAGHPQALAGVIASLSALRRHDEMLARIRQALTVHPGHAELGEVSADALSSLYRPSEDAIDLMKQLARSHPHDHRLNEALIRAASGEPELVAERVNDMIDRLAEDPVEIGSREATRRAVLILRAATTARENRLNDQARELINTALRMEPGSLAHFRELAFLELEEGHLDLARSYLEVLSFVDLGDKEAALTLARVLFERIGQPHKAAEVVRRAFQYNMPPAAVEIISAESFLRGRPEEALEAFAAVKGSPLVTAHTILNIGRIAYAAGVDDVAGAMFDAYLKRAPRLDPARERAELLRSRAAPRPPKGEAEDVVAGL